MQCSSTGSNDDPSRADIFALNSYSWCGDATYTSAGYDVLTADFVNTSIPVFFSEYGCNDVTPRVFTEVEALYGKNMTPILSGGLVYEYSQETSDYGLVVLNSNGSAQLRTDYYDLQTQFNKLNLTELQSTKATNTSNIAPVCTSSLISDSGFSNNFTLPAVPSGVASLIKNGISPKPTGKIVAITNTVVSQVVQGSSGAIITNLTLTVLSDDESNSPSGVNTSGAEVNSTSSSTTSNSTSTSSTSSGSATATKTSDARGLKIGSQAVGALAFAMAVALL
jgi:hypothetical protein